MDEGDIVICSKCNGEAVLERRLDGYLWDNAWGIPKKFPMYTLITDCCRCEDYEELSHDVSGYGNE